MDLSNVPLEALEAELRKRKLQEICVGELKVGGCGKKAEFALSEMPWPDGKYKIVVKCVEDLTQSEPESDLNNESQR